MKRILCKSSVDKKTINEYRKLKNCNFNQFIQNFIKDEEYEEYKKSLRSNEKFSLVFSDIDFFKEINDNYVHETGDYILHEFIKLIKIDLKDYDSIERGGGEEFLILLPITHIEKAVKIISRIKDRIENKDFIYDGQLIKITSSFGISEFNKEDTYLEILNTIDKLMYKAKQNGRNRTITISFNLLFSN